MPDSGEVAHHPFQGEPGLGPDGPGQGDEVLGDLGIALVRHGDRADRAGGEGLAQLTDLRPLQLVDLVANLAGGG